MNPQGLLVIQTANFEGKQAIKEGKKLSLFYARASGVLHGIRSKEHAIFYWL